MADGSEPTVTGEAAVTAGSLNGAQWSVNEQTRAILEHRRRRRLGARRGWLVRRALALADVAGLMLAFAISELVFGTSTEAVGRVNVAEPILFFATIPLWIVVAKLYGLYDHDEERTDHSTVDDVVGVFHLVTVGAWVVFAGTWITKLADPNLPKLASFWILAIVCITAGRALARAFCRRNIAYLQNTIIVGAGRVGQLVARKYLQHSEYGINLVGFIDDDPRALREEVNHLRVLGGSADIAAIIDALDVERVVIAFSHDSAEETVSLVRSLGNLDVQIDLVPRLFEIVGPNVEMHAVESLPLVGLPPARLSRSSALIKRCMDVVVASVLLVVTAPLFAYVAWRIKRESPGPVFFRQLRLGIEMKEFVALKFRTMKLDADDDAHRQYILRTMSADAAPNPNGLYKLDRGDSVIPIGKWLRRTSLDELPQLINVIRGEMSLVGPRPCIPYEAESFAPHHFERFLMPQGLTGLWQVTARAHSTFGEALEMDVAYVRGWSLGLDLRLLCRTPLQLVRRGGTA